MTGEHRRKVTTSNWTNDDWTLNVDSWTLKANKHFNLKLDNLNCMSGQWCNNTAETISAVSLHQWPDMQFAFGYHNYGHGHGHCHGHGHGHGHSYVKCAMVHDRKLKIEHCKLNIESRASQIDWTLKHRSMTIETWEIEDWQNTLNIEYWTLTLGGFKH